MSNTAIKPQAAKVTAEQGQKAVVTAPVPALVPAVVAPVVEAAIRAEVGIARDIALNPGEKALRLAVPAKHTGGYVSHRIDTKLPQDCAQKLRDIFDALHARHAQLKSGKHIENQQHALIYILENLA